MKMEVNKIRALRKTLTESRMSSSSNFTTIMDMKKNMQMHSKAMKSLMIKIWMMLIEKF